MNSVLTTQETFRQLVDAASYVGEIKQLSLEMEGRLPLPKALFQITETLLDQEVTFQTLNFPQTVAPWLQAELRSNFTAVEKADFVLCNFSDAEDFPWHQLALVKTGDLIDPQNSATILGYIEDFFTVGINFQLSGPGIWERQDIMLPKILREVFALREKLTREYPLGVDLILTDQFGKVLFIPRTTQVKEVN